MKSESMPLSKLDQSRIVKQMRLFFLHIQRELHCNNLPIHQLSWKQQIF